eukprot:757334-Hanusia_phi.AAC.2
MKTIASVSSTRQQQRLRFPLICFTVVDSEPLIETAMPDYHFFYQRLCEKSRTSDRFQHTDLLKPTRPLQGTASQCRIVIPHAEEGDYGEDGLNYMGHMVAGSMAGMSEHAIMYPADTIKTRMQVTASRHQPQYGSVYNALSLILKNEGIFGIYRGVGAVLLGAIPGSSDVVVLAG